MFILWSLYAIIRHINVSRHYLECCNHDRLQVREFFEWLVTFLRVDMQLSAICHSTHEKLLAYLADDKLFAKELTKHFAGREANVAFAISIKDPSQVAVLKKVLNALLHAEKAL